MDKFTAGPTDFQSYRDGFVLSVWTDGSAVLIRARPDRDAEQEQVPALPTTARIVVWSHRHGMIRDRLRTPWPWKRFVAWLRHTSVPTRSEQIEALADELLTAIERTALADAPWAETSRGDEPAQARPQILATFGEQRRSLMSRIARLGAVAAFFVVLGAAAALAVWRTANGGDDAGEAIVLAEQTATVDTSSDRGLVGGEAVSLVSRSVPAATTEAASGETSLVVPTPDAAGTAVEYVVASGDTLAGIAGDYGVSVAELRSANALASGDPIYPGQVLRIP
jgi:LysM repeat protein